MAIERPYTGLTAQVKLNDVIIGYINGVELSLEKEVIEILQFGATYKEKVPAIKDWTASVEGTVAFATGGSQDALYQAFESGDLVALTIMLDANTFFDGDALVTSLSISGAPDDALTLSAEFAGSGGVTFTLPNSFIVSLASGQGGSVVPTGNIRVAQGKSITINCYAMAGYAPDKYYIGESPTGTAITGTTFTLPTVQADQNVYVTFKLA